MQDAWKMVVTTLFTGHSRKTTSGLWLSAGVSLDYQRGKSSVVSAARFDFGAKEGDARAEQDGGENCQLAIGAGRANGECSTSLQFS